MVLYNARGRWLRRAGDRHRRTRITVVEEVAKVDGVAESEEATGAGEDRVAAAIGRAGEAEGGPGIVVVDQVAVVGGVTEGVDPAGLVEYGVPAIATPYGAADHGQIGDVLTRGTGQRLPALGRAQVTV